ncbi:APC family permease [Asanoa sp. NPDC050611]|uniref:APC family permease n=1 Tax=Asanoa sp. NPDC050611 TaxID=3157098 RepID=UPI0033C55767
MATAHPPAALARRLGLRDAVVVGLGSMLGAGIFVVFAPAAAAAGGVGLLVALGVAGFVAFCNATSSARLAARYPESGGAYVYGRERLGAFPGFLAGWAFVCGKTASCAAMALAIGAYAWPSHPRVVAVLAVLAVTAVNLRGIAKTAGVTFALVTVTLLVLAAVAVAGVASTPSLSLGAAPSARGVLTAAGLLFFAFAGYARIATLGEEVRDPARTIPRAIPLALSIVLAIYAVLAVVALAVLGPAGLAASTAPLASVASVAGPTALATAVRAGAVVAVLGVLVALLAGVGRTALAMGRRRDLPGVLASVHPSTQVPAVAELVVAAAVIVLVLVGGLTTAIAASSCLVLVYYAIANASALTLRPEQGRRLPVRTLAGLGLVGCLLLAATVPTRGLLAGAAILVLGAIWYATNRRFQIA